MTMMLSTTKASDIRKLCTLCHKNFNPLMGTLNRKATDHCKQQYGDRYTGRSWVGCYIWYSEEKPGWAAAPPSPLLAVQNIIAHPLTASVPTSCYTM